jgi:hypothetical protein
MATIRFACPDCGAKLKSDGEPGAAVECPKCGASATIPGELPEPLPDAEATTTETATEGPAEAPAEEPPLRIKAPWEYAKEWSRVRTGLFLCTIGAALTIAELATGEICDRLYRRAYSPAELYAGLVIGLAIGGFRIYGKTWFRHVPRQWGPRPLLWTCVGVEAALLVAVAGTAIALAATPAPPESEGPPLPAELTRNLSPRQQEELRKSLREAQDLHAGTPVQRDPRVRVVSIGFGLAILLAGLISILWPIYLKELASSVKDQDAWDIGDRVLDILGPAFMLWVLSVSIYQFAASVTEVSGVYRPAGKTVTIFGLLTIQCLLIRVYWRLRQSLRAKSRLRKPKPRPAVGRAKA